MSDRDIVDIAIQVIMRCGLLAEPYIRWHERTETERTWITFQPFWRERLKLCKSMMVTAGQMGCGMNAPETGQVDEEFDIQMDQFGQAHLARQDTTNSKFGMLKQQQQQLMQKMAHMCQQINMAANNTPPSMQQM